MREELTLTLKNWFWRHNLVDPAGKNKKEERWSGQTVRSRTLAPHTRWLMNSTWPPQPCDSWPEHWPSPAEQTVHPGPESLAVSRTSDSQRPRKCSDDPKGPTPFRGHGLRSPQVVDGGIVAANTLLTPQVLLRSALRPPGWLGWQTTHHNRRVKRVIELRLPEVNKAARLTWTANLPTHSVVWQQRRRSRETWGLQTSSTLYRWVLIGWLGSWGTFIHKVP